MLEILVALAALLIPADSAEIVFAGDAMQHQRQIDAARCADGSLDYSPYFTALQPYIESADYAVVNLETPLGGAPYSGYPMFCAHDNYLSALTDAGFDLMLSANNHILDRRDKGLLRTIETFERNNVPWVGIYRDAAHRESILPLIKDINGFKVAFLNYTYGTNGITKRTPVEIDYIDRELMALDVREAREAGAELIAVCIHWGDEYRLLPNQTQKSLAEFLTSLGVEMIIGGHPHVIQPMKLERAPLTGTPTLTVYSLGNFISAMRTTDTRGGAMVRVKLARDVMGRPYVKGASYRLVFTQQPINKGDNFKLLPVESDEVKGAARQQRDAFAANARRVFKRHNVNVAEDTVSIGTYGR
ncbi:MAG: CapA family protein [Muribaculaceae bacterium]|nr:CapA family protein [Muribaculaceae bacterium]